MGSDVLTDRMIQCDFITTLLHVLDNRVAIVTDHFTGSTGSP
jgi:hypothetical protein